MELERGHAPIDLQHCAKSLRPAELLQACAAINAALEGRDFIAEGSARKAVASRCCFEKRIAIHTGPMVAGIVGLENIEWGIWSDTVDTVSRLGSSGEAGQVNISEATCAMV
ncbi:MAG: adenylate/guanylate cyclase domain-containing protein [Flavobacteriales bacterium]|nr:adenylate/guanylate cyclase domain-containing protein [Flavobacteriales bacterium]